jgi:hypothetical protein
MALSRSVVQAKNIAIPHFVMFEQFLPITHKT